MEDAKPLAATVLTQRVQRLSVGNIDAQVTMHPSMTSAVATFVDDKGHAHRVALAARRGGGAMATWVPKRYEGDIRELGNLLWPGVRLVARGSEATGPSLATCTDPAAAAAAAPRRDAASGA